MFIILDLNCLVDFALKESMNNEKEKFILHIIVIHSRDATPTPVSALDRDII